MKTIVLLLTGFIVFQALPQQANGQIVPKDHTIPEGLFIHTDRELLVAGEYLLFSLSLFNDNGRMGDKQQEISRYAYLVLRNEHEMIDHQRVKLENGSAHGGFYLEDTLSTGYYEISGFTNWMRNQASGTFFRKHIFVANRFDEELTFSAGNPEEIKNRTIDDGQPRETASPEKKFRLNISDSIFPRRTRGYVNIEADMQGDHQGRLTVSIAPEGSYLEHNPTLAAYLSATTKHFKAHDPTAEPFPYFMETKGMVISGQVTDENGQAVPGSRVTLSKQDTLVNLKYADTCDGGLFHFLLDPYYDASRLFFSIVHEGENTGETIHLFEKAEVDFPFAMPGGIPSQEQLDLLVKTQDVVSIQKAYGLNHHDIVKDKDKEVFPSLVYSRANDIFYPEEYVPLNDVYEITRELILSWRIRGRGEEATHIMTDATLRQRMNDTPVFFADGVITDNILPYLELGSEDLLKIEAHDFHWQYGNMYFPGIISIFTKDPQFHFDQIRENYVGLLTDNPAVALRFAPPEYNKTTPQINHEKPDARQVLLWEPDIRIEGGQTVSLPFYTSDLNGRFVVTLQGITERGEPVFQQQIIEVQ